MLREDDFLFQKLYEDLKQQLNKAIEEAISKFPEQNKSRLRKFVRKNLTGIVRVSVKEFGGIKVLPLFKRNEANQFLTRHPALKNFIMNTGIFIGAINMRRYLMKSTFSGNDVRLGTKGAVPSSSQSELPLVSKTTLFASFVSKLQATNNPAVKNLGLATVNLILGLESKMQFQTIDPSKKELIRQAIFQTFLRLSDAESKVDGEFFEFATKIKLIHYDLMTLLELTRPYQASDFEPIYFGNLKEMGTRRIRAGLGKTGMNLFAGINKAINEGHRGMEGPVRVYGQGFYFEQAGVIGEDHSLEQALADPSVKKIDLFACQFNPNIEIAPDFTHYEVGKIENDIRRIFKEKPATDKLTVAVDSTIDYINSPKVQHLLKQFRAEIESGKINFVFFRSGQKLDMYGMDNYYGAPYVLVNNGSNDWSSFKILSESEALQTDSLSLQWFCLANEFTHRELDEYRHLIFQNTREILKGLPASLRNSEARLRVNTFDEEVDACFIDIKIRGKLHKTRAELILLKFYQHCIKHNMSVTTRASFGFHHANVILICINEVRGSSSIRLTPGINPEENKIIRKFLENLSDHL